jgi:hypothetical protein
MPSSRPEPNAYEAVATLASWVASPSRASGLRDAARALKALAKAQRELGSRSGALGRALRISYALLDVENLRDALLRQAVGPRYPELLLFGFPWKFGTEADRLTGDELVAAVRTFAEDLMGGEFDPATEEVCRPEAVVLEAGQVVVLGCSHPPGADPRFFTAQLRADDGRSFRGGELMAKLVGASAGALRDSGHRFFHGLKLKEMVGNPAAKIPIYEMCFSSDWVPPGAEPEVGWDRLKDLERWRTQWRDGSLSNPDGPGPGEL